jgi:hypothetical protein
MERIYNKALQVARVCFMLLGEGGNVKTPKQKKVAKIAVQVRLDPLTLEALQKEASIEKRSLAGQLELIVEKHYGLRGDPA